MITKKMQDALNTLFYSEVSPEAMDALVTIIYESAVEGARFVQKDWSEIKLPTYDTTDPKMAGAAELYEVMMKQAAMYPRSAVGAALVTEVRDALAAALEAEEKS